MKSEIYIYEYIRNLHSAMFAMYFSISEAHFKMNCGDGAKMLENIDHRRPNHAKSSVSILLRF